MSGFLSRDQNALLRTILIRPRVSETLHRIKRLSMKTQKIFDRIVEARRDCDLPNTQVAIAKDLGIAQSAVGKWKAGNGLKLAHAMAIAYQTGVCVEWLLTGRGPKTPPNEAWFKIMESLSPTAREEVMRFAKFRKEYDDIRTSAPERKIRYHIRRRTRKLPDQNVSR